MKKHEQATTKHEATADVQNARLWPSTLSQPSTPLINRIVNDRLLTATPRFLTGAARFMQLLQEII